MVCIGHDNHQSTNQTTKQPKNHNANHPKHDVHLVYLSDYVITLIVPTKHSQALWIYMIRGLAFWLNVDSISQGKLMKMETVDRRFKLLSMLPIRLKTLVKSCSSCFEIGGIKRYKYMGKKSGGFHHNTAQVEQ